MKPPTWDYKPLPECGRILAGGTPSRKESGFWNGDVPWISAKSLRRFDVADSAERVTEAGARATTLIPKGTVLFVVRGMSLAKEFRVGVTQSRVSFNQDLRALIPSAGIDGRYLARFLQATSSKILALADSASHGTKRLTSERLEEVMVPLPPLAEQRRIAAILDKADALRAKRGAALKQLDALMEVAFLHVFGDPSTNPKGWRISTIGELLSIPPNFGTMTPGTRARKGWLNLRVANIKNWTIDLSDKKYVDIPPTAIARHTVENGDMLLARAIGSEEHLGKAVVVDTGGERWAFDSHLMRLRFDQRKALPEVVRQLFLTKGGRSLFLAATRRSAVQFNINTREILGLKIPLADIASQRIFLQGATAVQHHRAQQRRSEEEFDALFASLQHRAFRGEL